MDFVCTHFVVFGFSIRPQPEWGGYIASYWKSPALDCQFCLVALEDIFGRI